MDEDVCLILEGIVRVTRSERSLPEDQRQPYARAVGTEARDIERAFVQIFVADRKSIVRLGIALGPGRRRDELVDIFAAAVVAHVEGGAPAGGEKSGPAALLAETAERRELARRFRRIAGGAFDDPAELVRLRSEEHTSELQSLMRISYAV